MCVWFWFLFFVSGGCEAVMVVCECSEFSRCCHLYVMGYYIAVWIVCMCWYLCLACLLVLLSIIIVTLAYVLMFFLCLSFYFCVFRWVYIFFVMMGCDAVVFV